MFSWLDKVLNYFNEPASGVRARNDKGRFVADDKSTKDVNEAYVDGKTPKRKPRKAPAKKPTTGKKGRPRKTAVKK